MKYSIPGLGGRLQRARKETRLSQEAVGDRIGVSWMTVHRWERYQRAISDKDMERVSELYDKPIRWFLTLEDGDLGEESGPPEAATGRSDAADSNAVARL